VYLIGLCGFVLEVFNVVCVGVLFGGWLFSYLYGFLGVLWCWGYVNGW